MRVRGTVASDNSCRPTTASAGTRDGVKDQPTNLAARAPLHAQVGLLPGHAIARLGFTRTLFLGTLAPLIRERAVRLGFDTLNWPTLMA